MPHFKKLTDKHKEEIERQVKSLLHACRDAMRNHYAGLQYQLKEDCSSEEDDLAYSIRSRMEYVDSKQNTYQVSDGYYSEAFGVFRALEILGYGVLNANEQTYHNLRWWFNKLGDEVLKEEGFYDKTHKCDFCVKAWGKDGAGRTRETLKV